jgi:hypothetical protein
MGYNIISMALVFGVTIYSVVLLMGRLFINEWRFRDSLTITALFSSAIAIVVAAVACAISLLMGSQ